MTQRVRRAGTTSNRGHIERDIFDKMVPDGYIVYRCGNCGQVFRKEAGA